MNGNRILEAMPRGRFSKEIAEESFEPEGCEGRMIKPIPTGVRMRLTYLAEERDAHWRTVIRGFIPRGLLLLRAILRYRRWFPGACVSPGSLVAREARLAKGVVVHDAVIGGTVELGDYTTIGDRSSLSGEGKISIGRFCSIGPDCFLRSDNHLMGAITTYPLLQMVGGSVDQSSSFQASDIRIGHDVWLGRGVTVLAGAHIGDGCIVAAGCVVAAGDYPPYSIIGGVPGRVLKLRFSEDIIRKLLADPWWDWPDADIFIHRKPHLLSAPKDM